MSCSPTATIKDTTPFLLRIAPEKHLLQFQQYIDKHLLLERALDCKFHHYIKRDMIAQLTSEIATKAEFIEENDIASMALKVRGEVVVLSVTEFQRMIRTVEAELKRLRAENERLKTVMLGEARRLKNSSSELYVSAGGD